MSFAFTVAGTETTYKELKQRRQDKWWHAQLRTETTYKELKLLPPKKEHLLQRKVQKLPIRN